MHPEQESVDLELAKSHEAAEYLGMKNWSAADTQQKRRFTHYKNPLFPELTSWPITHNFRILRHYMTTGEYSV